MFTWAKLASGLVTLFNSVLAAFQRKQDRDAGAAIQRDVTDAATTKTLEDVSAPIGGADSDKLWDSNKAKFGPSGSKSGN